MPKATEIKTKSGDGQLYADHTEDAVDGSSGAAAGGSDGQTGSSLKEVQGNNLGFGHGVFAGANNGPKLATLDFRTLIAGTGIAISGDKNSLTITSTGVVTPDLEGMAGTLSVQHGGTGCTTFSLNSILLGNASGPLQELVPPSGAGDKLLHWDGSAYSWVTVPTMTNGTVTSVSASAGSSKVTVTGGPITTSGTFNIDVVESNLNLNNLGGTLAITKGGTGATSFTNNALLVGNGTGALTSIATPSTSGQVLSWNGTTYSWATQSTGVTGVSAVGQNGITANATNSSGAVTVTVGLGSVGVTEGTYSYPTMTVDQYGRVTSISSNAAQTYDGSNLGTGGQGIFAGKTGTTFTFKQITGSNGVSITSSATSVNVGLSTVPIANGGTGAASFTTGSLLYADSTQFRSVPSAPASGTNLLGFDGTNYGWYGMPGSTAVTSSTSAITVTSGTSGTVTTYQTTFNPGNVGINNLAGTLDVTKGGTGATTLTSGALLVGNGTGAVQTAPVPSMPDQYMHWSGTAYEWVQVLPDGVQSLLAGEGLSTSVDSSEDGGTITSAGSLNLTNTGVTAGDYSVLAATVNKKGQITSATDASSYVLNRANHTGLTPLNQVSGVLSADHGGTGFSSYLTGDLLIGSVTGDLEKLQAPTASGSVLGFDGDIVRWMTPSSYSLTAATSTDIGGVKPGIALGVQVDGTLDVQFGAGLGVSLANALFVRLGQELYVDGVGDIRVAFPEPSPVDASQVTGLAAVATSGDYNDLINAPADYTLNPATTTTLGGVIVGNGLEVTFDGTLSVSTGDGLTFGVAGEVIADLGDGLQITAGQIAVRLGSGLQIDGSGAISVSASAGLGTVTSVGVVSTDSKISVTGSPITDSGTISLTLNEANINVGNTSGSMSSTRVTGLSAVATSGDYADLSNTPTLFSGSYNDLTDTPALFDGTWLSLSGKPTFATVATSGSYTDLLNQPSLFSGAYADLTGKPTLFSGAYADLTGKPGLATVATSGAYSDLSGTPNLSVYATTTQLTSLQSTLESEIAAIPTYELPIATDTVLGGIIVGAGLAIDGAGVLSASGSSFSGSYNDLTDLPTLSTVATSGAYADLIGAPSEYVLPAATDTVLGGVKVGNGLMMDVGDVLSISYGIGLLMNGGVLEVAIPEGGYFSGNYDDLANKPTLFSGAYADLTGVPVLSTVATTGSYADLLDTPSAYSLPTSSATVLGGVKVGSNLSIDGAGVLSVSGLATVATSGDYNDLTNKPSAYSLPTASSTVLGGIKVGTGLSIDGAGVLSATGGGTGTVTSVALSAGSSKVSVTGSPITSSGTITVDVNEGNLTLANLSGNLSSARVTGLATVATSGDYADLINKPIIPTLVSDLTNDSGFVTQAGARSAISITAGSSGVTYNSTTGVMDFTGLATGGSSVPSGATAQGWYKFSMVMNAGNTTTNGTDPATIGLTGLPSGWSVSVTSGIATFTHTVGRPPVAVNFLVGTTSTTNPVYKMVAGGNTGATGLVGVPSSGSTVPDTTRFQFQLTSAMSTIANGSVYVMVQF